MRRNLENRFALAESVELCLEEHENAFAADDALLEARNKLREQLRVVCELARDPRGPRKSLTGERRKVRDLLVQALVEIHGIMHAWAAATQNERVREQTRNAPYRIHGLPDLALLDMARETRTLLEKHWRGLERFGMEGPLRRAFARLQKEFERILQTAGLAVGLAAEVTDGDGTPAMGHDEVLDGLVRHIREVVDPLVWQYQQRAPRFVRAYRSVRRVASLPEAGDAQQPARLERVELLG